MNMTTSDAIALLRDVSDWAEEKCAHYKSKKPLNTKLLLTCLTYQDLRDSSKKVANLLIEGDKE